MLGFKVEKPIIGVVHLDALPGSPCFDSMKSVLNSALEDTNKLIEGGVDGLIVENFGDKPFTKKVDDMTISAMSVIIEEITNITDLPVGINVLRNDWRAALSIANVINLDFIRINVYSGIEATPEGLIEGEAGEIQRFREKNNIKCFILADINVKHGKAIYPREIEDGALDAAERGLADALILSGVRTGKEVDLDELKKVKSLVNTPVFIGSGLNQDNVKELMTIADGGIVGTFFKKDGDVDNSVSSKRVKDFMSEVEHIR